MANDPQQAHVRVILETPGRGLRPATVTPGTNAVDPIYKSEDMGANSTMLPRVASATGTTLSAVPDVIELTGTTLGFEAAIPSHLAYIMPTMFGKGTDTASGDNWDLEFRANMGGDTNVVESLAIPIDRDNGRRFAVEDTAANGLKLTLAPQGLVAADVNLSVGKMSSFAQPVPTSGAHLLRVDGWDAVGLYQPTADVVAIEITAIASGVRTFTATLNAEDPITYAGPAATWLELRHLIRRAGSDKRPVVPRIWFAADTVVGDTWTISTQPAAWTPSDQGEDLAPVAQIWSYLNIGGISQVWTGIEVDMQRPASSGYNGGQVTPGSRTFDGGPTCKIVLKRKQGSLPTEAENLAWELLRARGIIESSIIVVADSGQLRPGATTNDDTYKLEWEADAFTVTGASAGVDRTQGVQEEQIEVELNGNWYFRIYADVPLTARA